jgi:DNA-binding Lrp family transcriptional regulator
MAGRTWFRRTGMNVGYALEVVAIQLRQGKPVRDTVESLRAVPEVRSVQRVTGRWDVLPRCLIRDHLLRFAAMRTTAARFRREIITGRAG